MPQRDLKAQLIRLGHRRPDLRPHLRPVLDGITKTSAQGSLQHALQTEAEEWMEGVVQQAIQNLRELDEVDSVYGTSNTISIDAQHNVDVFIEIAQLLHDLDGKIAVHFDSYLDSSVEHYDLGITQNALSSAIVRIVQSILTM